VIIPWLAGCWNRIEVNDIAIVTATGLDRMKDGNIRLSLQVGIPANLGPVGGGGKSRPGDGTFVISATSATISDAYRKLQEKLARQIFFSHSRVLIIGEKLARNGMSEVIDFYTRYEEPRIMSLIMFTKGEAARVLKAKAKLESVPAEETRELTKLGIGLKVSIKEFWQILLTEGIEPVAPQLKLQPLETKSETESQTKNRSAEKIQATQGAAVYKKGKLIGWMNDKETRGILWLRNELKTGIITVHFPREQGGGKTSAKIIKATTDINPKLQDDKLKIEVNVRSEAAILENTSKMNLNDSKVIKLFQKDLEEEVQNLIQLTLNKAQKQFHSDIFGFGRTVYQAYPKEWNKQYKQKWDEEFRELKVTIKPKVIVTRTGFTKATK
jgi:spore germination protein KC